MTRHRQSDADPRGIVLIVVLVVIAILALSAYTFCDGMRAHHAAADVHADLTQSKFLARSAVAAGRGVLMVPLASRQQLGGLFHNPALFQNQIVVADPDPRFSGNFSIVAPTFDAMGTPNGLRFGLQNESAKLNLNALVQTYQDDESAEAAALAALADTLVGDGDPTEDDPADGSEGEDVALVDPTQRDTLMKLPGMTLEIADAILDWMDADDIPREFGAEVDYYSALSTPYLPRNGPLATLEELLMVRGVTMDLLFGRDWDRNGWIDTTEAQRVLPVELDPTLGSLDLGWRAYLTLVSQEVALDPLGEPRIDVNDDDLEALHASLISVIDGDLATFIIAYRQNGPYQEPEAPPAEGPGNGGNPNAPVAGNAPPNQNRNEQDTGDVEDPGEPVNGRSVDLTNPANANIENLLDLVGARVQATLDGDEEPTLLASPLPENPQGLAESLMTLFDYVTADGDSPVPGRVNLNEAPLPVLMSLPGMTLDVANVVVNQGYAGNDRLNSPRRHPVWLLTEGLVTLDTMRQMAPYVTGGGDVYRGHAVGYLGDGRRISRVEFVIDGTRPDVPVVGWKDMQAAGRGYLPQQLDPMNVDAAAMSTTR